MASSQRSADRSQPPIRDTAVEKLHIEWKPEDQSGRRIYHPGPRQVKQISELVAGSDPKNPALVRRVPVGETLRLGNGSCRLNAPPPGGGDKVEESGPPQHSRNGSRAGAGRAGDSSFRGVIERASELPRGVLLCCFPSALHHAPAVSRRDVPGKQRLARRGGVEDGQETTPETGQSPQVGHCRAKADLRTTNHRPAMSARQCPRQRPPLPRNGPRC